MVDLNKISKKWLEELEQILADYPDLFLRAKCLCGEGNYKDAFLLVEAFLREAKLYKKKEFNDIDTDFFFALR